MAGGTTYTQTFDVYNRLIQVTRSDSPEITRFEYGPGEQRTKTIIETSEVERTVIYYPFPNYEEEHHQAWTQLSCIDNCGYMWQTAETVERSTYSLAGQMVAVRVSSSPAAPTDGLYYTHSDHTSASLSTSLGSASFMTDENGVKQLDTEARYLPFGGYRWTPTDELSDLGFTGHKHNPYIKLIYMNARWYDPAIGRFLSADTIIPNPTNPQSHNRYSYVLNSPLNFTDPTGHCYVSPDSIGEQICEASPPPQPVIWERSPIDDPDWVQYYGQTEFAEERDPSYSTNEGQHAGLDYGIFAERLGGTFNNETREWEYDGTYGTDENPLIPVYAGCHCQVNVVDDTGNSYKPSFVELTHEDLPEGYYILYGHLRDIQVVAGQEVTPDTVIGYLEAGGDYNHVHIEIRDESGNFINPYPYLTSQLRRDLLGFEGNGSQATYQTGTFFNQPRSGYYTR